MGKRLEKASDRAKEKQQYKRSFLAIFIAVAVFVVLLVNFFTIICSVVHYYGDSMEPSLQDRQILVVHKTDKVSRGDTVAFYYNNMVLVRRIIAEGGNSIEIESDGRVILDGNILEVPYITEPALGQCNISFPYTIPSEEFFVMGDNRPISMDSRLEEIGTVPRSRIMGKVIFAFG